VAATKAAIRFFTKKEKTMLILSSFSLPDPRSIAGAGRVSVGGEGC
jgi:hypothetical protein